MSRIILTTLHTISLAVLFAELVMVISIVTELHADKKTADFTYVSISPPCKLVKQKQVFLLTKIEIEHQNFLN